MLIVLVCPLVSPVPRLRILNPVVELPVMLLAVVLPKVTVPEPGVKVPPLFVQLPPTLMRWLYEEKETRVPPPVEPLLMVRSPVIVRVWAMVLLPPRFTVATPVPELGPIFRVTAVVVSAEPAVLCPMLIVLACPLVSPVPRLRILNPVVEVPLMLLAVVPPKVTVPEPGVKVPPLFVQLSLTVKLYPAVGAVKVPLVYIVT
jgi:hypothetical protein